MPMPRFSRKSFDPAQLAEILASGSEEPDVKARMLCSLGHDEATMTEIYRTLLERLATKDDALRQAGEAIESGRAIRRSKSRRVSA